jgi:hypothetical protein
MNVCSRRWLYAYDQYPRAPQDRTLGDQPSSLTGDPAHETELEMVEVLQHLGLALAIGLLIGMERRWQERSRGLRQALNPFQFWFFVVLTQATAR